MARPTLRRVVVPVLLAAGVVAGSPAAPASASVTEALRCATPARSAGFTRTAAVTAVAIGMAESRCVATAVGLNGPTASCPDGSRDRGLWQVNDCYHPTVVDACAFDPWCNARAASSISSAGSTWRPWSTYTNGSYRQYLSTAGTAVDQAWAATLLTWPAARSGATGERVRTVQYLLRHARFTVAPDGVFGSGTASAVSAFQRQRLLTADAVVGRLTWQSLTPTVRRGGSGDAVRAVQSQLRARGYAVTVDGAFGSATESAVTSFQTSRGLTADGVVGMRTWNALVS